VNILQLQRELLRQHAILSTAGRKFEEEIRLTWTRTDQAAEAVARK
jgi:hypothetical protein